MVRDTEREGEEREGEEREGEEREGGKGRRQEERERGRMTNCAFFVPVSLGH